MALTTDQYQQLMRFLDADMSMEEMAAFEKELDANPELRAQLNLELQVTTALGESNNVFPNVNKGKLVALPATRKKLWIAAASIMAIAILATYFLLRSPKNSGPLVNNTDSIPANKKDSLPKGPTPSIAINTKDRNNTDSLFKQFYKRPGLPDSYPIILADAFDHYSKNNYVPIEAFDIDHLPIVRGGENEEETIKVLATFYKGIADLQQQKADSAISRFKWMIAHYSNSKQASKAHWYLALAYLKKGNTEDAVKELHAIRNDRQYGSDATLILNTLTR